MMFPGSISTERVLVPARKLAGKWFAIWDRTGFWWRALQAVLMIAILAGFMCVALWPLSFVLTFLDTYFSENTVGSLGTVWFMAVLVWFELRRRTTPWPAAMRPALTAVVLGLTPQILFLMAYNGGLPRWQKQQGLLRAVILGYERTLLRLHLWLKPLEDHGLVALVLVIVVAGTVMLLRRQPAILTRSLKTFSTVQYVSYVVVIAASFTVASNVSEGDYQPDARRRLAAEEMREAATAAGLLLTEEATAAVRSGKTTILGDFARLARAVDNEHEDLSRMENVNKAKAENAGIRALVAQKLAGIPNEIKVPARSPVGQTADPVGTYYERRKEADALELREEVAKEALKQTLVQAANLGAFGAAPFSGLLHDYLQESIDEAAEFLASRLLARIRFEDLRVLGGDTVKAMREALGTVLPDVLSRLVTTSGTAQEPRLPQEFEAAEERDVVEQRKQEERTETERRPTEEP